MDKSKSRPAKKLPQEVLSAQWALDSAVVCGESESRLFLLRMLLTKAKDKHKIKD